MSSIPIYAINTSCRTVGCTTRAMKRGQAAPQVTVGSGATVAGASNVSAPSSPSPIPPPSSPSHIPPPSSPTHIPPPSSPAHLSLPSDVRLRSSSMNHLDKSNTRRVVERDRMLDALNIFS